MMSEHKISIIIPCYCQQEYLPRVLKSLKNQEYKNFEVIIVDDGSPEAVTIPNDIFPFEMRLIRQTNKGLSAARNTGLKYSSGSLVKFLDADDCLTPDCLQMQVDNINPNGSLISIVGVVEEEESSGIKNKIMPTFGDAKSAVFIDNLAPIHCYLFPISALNVTGGFSLESRVSGGCEDYDLIFRLIIAGYQFSTIHQVGAIYYRRAGTMSRNQLLMQRSRMEVWLYNVDSWLSSFSLQDVEYIVPMLTGLIKLYEITPNELTHRIDLLIKKIIKVLSVITANLPAAECGLLSRRMRKHKNLDEIRSVLDAHVGKNNILTLSINPQSLNDYRVILNGSNSALDDEWIIRILQSVKKYNGEIGIYGAGDIGHRIYDICNAAGFTISCFFDKEIKNNRAICGVPIHTIDKISSSGVKAIIIGSVAYYEEIHSFLSCLSPNVTVI